LVSTLEALQVRNPVSKFAFKFNVSCRYAPDTYARIAPRSGLAWKHFIDTGAGVVDYDYRGNVGVILFNHSDKDFEVKKGDRVAQMILERITTPEVGLYKFAHSLKAPGFSTWNLKCVFPVSS
jgi:deoxyuridine 5'-triphosphate nucleotidohydrolase